MVDLFFMWNSLALQLTVMLPAGSCQMIISKTLIPVSLDSLSNSNHESNPNIWSQPDCLLRSKDQLSIFLSFYSFSIIVLAFVMCLNVLILLWCFKINSNSIRRSISVLSAWNMMSEAQWCQWEQWQNNIILCLVF